jgi:hypothetical protein
MISVELLRVALVALGSVLTLMVATLLVHAVLLTQSNLRNRHLLAMGRGSLSVLVDGSGEGEMALQRLATLPRRLQIRLLAEVALPLTGAHRERLTETYRRLGMVDWAVRRCRSRFWWRRLQAVRVLTLLRTGGESVRPLVQDPHPLVRAQAIEWWATAPEPEIVATLVEHLGDASRLCRFTVQDTLLRMGPLVAPALLRGLEGGAAPGTANALRVAAGLADPRFLEPALRHSASTDARVRARAATLLGAVGGAAAVERLMQLLRDPEPRARVAAATALGEMEHWPGAHAVAPLLRDPAWEVRRAAGLSLRAMGSPGELFLRRIRTDPDPDIAGMAKQVLDLPGESRPLASRR